MIFGTMKDDMIVVQHVQLILYNLTNVYVTETSSTMTSTLSQKMLTIFCQKLNILCVYFAPFDFVHISPACVPNGETLEFKNQRQ